MRDPWFELTHGRQPRRHPTWPRGGWYRPTFPPCLTGSLPPFLYHPSTSRWVGWASHWPPELTSPGWSSPSHCQHSFPERNLSWSDPSAQLKWRGDFEIELLNFESVFFRKEDIVGNKDVTENRISLRWNWSCHRKGCFFNVSWREI